MFKGKISFEWKVTLVVTALVIGTIAYFVVPVFIGFHRYAKWIRDRTAVVTAPANAEPAGRALALLCQTCRTHPDWFDQGPTANPVWTPAEVSKLEPIEIEIKPDLAIVGFGGGFQPFGYTLDPDPQATSPANQTAWVLTFFNEGSKELVLSRFTLGNDESLNEQQFVSQVMAEFDRRIATNFDAKYGSLDSDASTVAQRCEFAIKHHQIEWLKKAIHESVRQNPRDWRDALLAYLVDHAVDPTGAAEQLRQWASSVGDFSAWLMAAYALERAGDGDSAAEAVMKACRFSADDPEWGFNTLDARYRGFAMCRRLYADRQFQACAALCDALLAYKSDLFTAEISSMRDSCLKSDKISSTTLPDAIDGNLFDPFAGIDIKSLMTPSPATAP
jgi:hypothetical protein